jgi:hypothetical protein
MASSSTASGPSASSGSPWPCVTAPARISTSLSYARNLHLTLPASVLSPLGPAAGAHLQATPCTWTHTLLPKLVRATKCNMPLSAKLFSPSPSRSAHHQSRLQVLHLRWDRTASMLQHELVLHHLLSHLSPQASKNDTTHMSTPHQASNNTPRYPFRVHTHL